MLIDYQQHYTPPEHKGDPGKLTVDLDRDGDPSYLPATTKVPA
jgi:hypothetical protein